MQLVQDKLLWYQASSFIYSLLLYRRLIQSALAYFGLYEYIDAACWDDEWEEKEKQRYLEVKLKKRGSRNWHTRVILIWKGEQRMDEWTND